jgi:hypothetical protein
MILLRTGVALTDFARCFVMATLDVASDTLLSAIYISSAAIRMSAADLAKLLEKSRENNKKRGITGMLLYRNGEFMQVIEGPAAKIEDLLKTLEKDKRHWGMQILHRSVIPERRFSQWQMGFRDLSGVNLKDLRLEAYSPFMEWSFNDQEFQKKPDLCYHLLLNFRQALW